jgi:hypothetical protein
MARFDPASDPIAAPVRALFTLFEEHALPAGGFPDVTSQSMETHMGEVQACHAAVADAHATLMAAEAALATQQGELLKHAQRGMGYARVFADGDAPLTEQLDGLGFLAGERTERRGRKRRVKGTEPARVAQLALHNSSNDAVPKPAHESHLDGVDGIDEVEDSAIAGAAECG